ncbi:MAG: hypothetical protein ACLRWP_11075 [Bilophila wadsworthia]
MMFFEIGHQNWGKAAEGAALGTDGKEIKVRYSYVDWIIPQTDAKVRMGLQPYDPADLHRHRLPDPRRRRRGHHHQQPVHRKREREPVLAARRK